MAGCLSRLCAIGLCGCGGHDATTTQQNSVTAFVAASTQDAVKDVAEKFTHDTGIAVKISPGGSNTLAQQILNGAEADVFLSANEQWADAVKKKGFAAETRPLLTNGLVLVVPKENPAGIKRPEDLLGAKVEHVALAGENVPAGIYGKQALDSLHVYDDLVRDKKIVQRQRRASDAESCRAGRSGGGRRLLDRRGDVGSRRDRLHVRRKIARSDPLSAGVVETWRAESGGAKNGSTISVPLRLRRFSKNMGFKC